MWHVSLCDWCGQVRTSALDAIRRRLEGVEVYTVDRVVTYLVDAASAQPLPNSDAESTCFVDQRPGRRPADADAEEPGSHGEDEDDDDNEAPPPVYAIYISKLVSADSEELQTLVADAVNAISGHLLRNSVC